MLKTNHHSLLLHQLKRSKISPDDIKPDFLEKWTDFLLRISRAYTNYDQDLYLLERSMNLSSNELSDLNEKLESAQQIAHLGYWRYDREKDLLYWSKEMYQLTGFDSLQAAPTLDELKKYISEDDCPRLGELFKQALFERKEFSMELKFKNKQTGKFVYHYIKGHPENQDLEHESARYLTGIVIDITERKKQEIELEETHQKLLSISRQAGMAEIATSILHNIGNILNSAGVSIETVLENMNQTFYSKLFKINTMLKENRDELSEYLTQNEKGKLIPEYLIELIDIIAEEHESNLNEIHNINANLSHIKEIVAMQKTISGTSGFVEKIFIPDIAETALQMASDVTKENHIKIIKNFAKVPFIFSDKAKILQIIVNLIRNAKDAVANTPLGHPKEINIIIKNEANNILVLVTDNGSGITPEIKKLLFSFGFTTKKEGHGFGLHSSALLARELGGSLEAASPGKNGGATFTLKLPITTTNK